MLRQLHLVSTGESGLKVLSVEPAVSEVLAWTCEAQCLRSQLLQRFRHFMSLFWGRERNHSLIPEKQEKCNFLTLKLDDSLRICRNKTAFILQMCSAMSWIAYQ